MKILPGLTTIIGGTEAEALRRRDELVDLIPWDYSLNRLAGTLGITADRLQLDAPLPEPLTRCRPTATAAPHLLQHRGGAGPPARADRARS